MLNRITRDSSRIAAPAAWLAIIMTLATVLLLASLHVLSPEFAPSWRMVSEYAFGHHGWVLALMFLCCGVSSWALAVAIWPKVKSKTGKVGLWLLVVAGIGEAMASVFDVTHDTGHGIAGLLAARSWARAIPEGTSEIPRAKGAIKWPIRKAQPRRTKRIKSGAFCGSQLALYKRITSTPG